MRAIVKGASVALEKTTDMLPVLKQVDVVDRGGKGLLCLYEGFLSSLTGEVIISEDHSKKSEAHSHAVFEETNERSEEHTSELQSRFDLVSRLLLEHKN